jgi:pre-rRNA-processing protein TSR1
VASTFGPITFHPSPVLIFKRLANGSLMSLGSGTLMSVDPDRIILKKVNLVGWNRIE